MASLDGGARTTRTTFLVGKLTPRSMQIVVVEGTRPSPIPGPWTLRAVVRGGRPAPDATGGVETIH